jgi:hypothetical protein
LIEKLSTLERLEDLLAWARNVMPLKNRLLQEHAAAIEQAFEKKMSALTLSGENQESRRQPELAEVPDQTENSARKTHSRNGPGSKHLNGGTKIDKSVLALPTVKRHRNKAHLRFVATHACLVCGREPSDPHHVRFAQPKGLGQKVSDEFVVPLCRTHHREVHNTGKEQDWWTKNGIDPIKIASELWRESTANANMP